MLLSTAYDVQYLQVRRSSRGTDKFDYLTFMIIVGIFYYEIKKYHFIIIFLCHRYFII